MRRLAAVALAALLLAGCSGDDGADGVPRSTESSAFEVDVPDGFVLVDEGPGTSEAAWGDDSTGNTGGYTVLGPDADEDELGRLAVVELVGFGGMQGGLFQASTVSGPGEGVETSYDDRPAVFSSGSDPFGPVTELLAERARNLAIAVRGGGLRETDLQTFVWRTSWPEDVGAQRTTAPEVDPPEGWSEVGRADTALVLALGGYPRDLSGPRTAHSALWRGDDPGATSLMVMTLPGTAGDVAAALAFGRTSHSFAEPVEVDRYRLDGREAVWLRQRSLVGDETTVVTTTGWGDLLVVKSRTRRTDGDPPLDRAALEAVASSIRQAG